MNFRKAVFILSIIILLAGIHLYVYARNISLKYEITDLKIRLSELKSKNRQLGSEVSRAENLGKTEKIAKEKLGMIYPSDITYIIPAGSKGNYPFSTEETTGPE